MGGPEGIASNIGACVAAEPVQPAGALREAAWTPGLSLLGPVLFPTVSLSPQCWHPFPNIPAHGILRPFSW
jgi:hypothetical protein